MSKNPMSRQDEWIERMIQRAEADEPVYITDVREAFDRYGERAFHIHAFLYEGGRERFPLSLPEWENDRQRSFTAEYVRAFLYNLLSTLGALKIEIYLDTEDGELVSLAEGLEDDFQVNCRKEERMGYGKSLNVNERTIKALKGDRDRFSIVIRDIAEEEIPARTAECESGSDVFAGLPAAAAESFLLGIDVGGTDIKFAVSRAGRLVHFEELDWAPASFQEVSLLTQPVMDAAERLMKEFGEGRKWDAIGLSWPDVIIRNMIVGGETTKTKGLRENTQRDYEEQFSELTGLCGRLKEYVRDSGAVMCTNDGVMAAFTDAVEMAAAGEDVSKGFFAYSLGTELGTGWIRADGSVPQIPLEVYNCIIDLGSCRARSYQPEDVRSCRNVNTLLPGSLQKYTGQSGVFRLAAKQLPEKEPALYREALERGLFEVKGAGELIIVPTEPEDMRKDCLEFFMEKAALEESEVCRDIFRTIGEYIAVTWAENEYLLHPQAKERTLFGRLVKRSECFELIKEGAEKKEPSLVLRNADADLAVTPLMKQLAEDPVYTVAQFAQAVGALYFGCLGLCSSQDTR